MYGELYIDMITHHIANGKRSKPSLNTSTIAKKIMPKKAIFPMILYQR